MSASVSDIVSPLVRGLLHPGNPITNRVLKSSDHFLSCIFDRFHHVCIRAFRIADLRDAAADRLALHLLFPRSSRPPHRIKTLGNLPEHPYPRMTATMN